MKTRKILRTFKQIADELNCDVIDITCKKHYKVVLKRRSDGATATTIVAASPRNIHYKQYQRQILRLFAA